MKKGITLIIFVMIFNSVVFGVAETPMYPNAVLWEPFEWQMGTQAGNTLISGLDYENDEWTAYRYQNTNPSNGSIGDCNRPEADSLSQESGVTFIFTHGNDEVLVLASADSNAPLIEWRDNNPNLYVSGDTQYCPDNNGGGYNVYMVSADPTYCANNWASDHNNNKSIVFLFSCYAHNVFTNAVGGKTVFGYPDNNNVFGDAHYNVWGIINHMSGWQDNGLYRVAGDAYSHVTLYGNLQKVGGDSTLAPAPAYDNDEECIVCAPVGSGAGESGSGYIMFDTIMDTDANPSLALAWSYSGTVEVTNIAWDTSNTNKITFDYCGQPGYTLYMQATTTYCRAPHLGGVHYSMLDGDRTGGNYDDFNWTFSY